jgi:monoterpene epsilon-lactone hydrolase
MSNPGFIGDESTAAPALPERPSLRARIMTWLVRLVVKRWPRGDYEKLVRRARRLFGLPDWMSCLVSREITYETVQGADICGEWVIPVANYYEEKVLLYLHGGGYVSCTPRTHRPITASLARLTYQRVFALDYRLAPEAPFPAAVDDAAHAFIWLLELGLKPHNIAIAGDSAGGGLVMAMLLRLKARQQPLPACAICLSPWVDLTGAASYGNAESCAMFRPEDVSAFAELYLNGKSPRLPEASPVFGDLHGLPPLLIQASTTELLFDEAVQLQKKAQRSGVDCTLSAYPGLLHVWQMCAGLMPEAGTALKEIAAFIRDKTHEKLKTQASI